MIYPLYLIETPFNAFANRSDPDQVAHLELPDQELLCLLMETWYICSYTSGPDKQFLCSMYQQESLFI